MKKRIELAEKRQYENWKTKVNFNRVGISQVVLRKPCFAKYRNNNERTEEKRKKNGNKNRRPGKNVISLDEIK